MPDIFEWSLKDWISQVVDLLKYVFRKWYFLLLGAALGGLYGYWPNRNIKPTYTATISFVLSTESARGGGSGLAGLAAQLGLDAGITNGSENVFSGDNIIELFKSRKMAMKSLMAEIEPNAHQTLFDFMVINQYPKSKSLMPFPADPEKFNSKQKALFQRVAGAVSKSFIVFKKDKKLVFYYISATSANERIAYYIAKSILKQTSDFFIETKTSAAARGLRLLQKEADSLAIVLGGTYHSTAALADRTYNINPSLMVQRSSGQFSQARAMALGAAYTEVMRNLEIAKINLQKEIPLYSVIDEPVLPLAAQKMDVKRHSLVMGAICLVLAGIALIFVRIYFTLLKPLLFQDAQ